MSQTMQEPATFQRVGRLPRVGVDLSKILRANRLKRRTSRKLLDGEFLIHPANSSRWGYFLHTHCAADTGCWFTSSFREGLDGGSGCAGSWTPVSYTHL